MDTAASDIISLLGHVLSQVMPELDSNLIGRPHPKSGHLLSKCYTRWTWSRFELFRKDHIVPSPIPAFSPLQGGTWNCSGGIDPGQHRLIRVVWQFPSPFPGCPGLHGLWKKNKWNTGSSLCSKYVLRFCCRQRQACDFQTRFSRATRSDASKCQYPMQPDHTGVPQLYTKAFAQQCEGAPERDDFEWFPMILNELE